MRFDQGKPLQYNPIIEAVFPPKEKFVKRIIKLGNLIKVNSVIEFGCGHGREAALLSKLSGWDVLATDASPDMLQNLPTSCNSCLIDVMLPLPKEYYYSFDIAYCSFLMHLLPLEGKKQFFQNSASCLKPGGILICLTASENDLQRRLIADYFPTAISIDTNRYLTIYENKELLSAVGFTKIAHENIFLGNIGLEEHIDFYREKRSSILRLIPEVEYQKGLDQLSKDIKNRCNQVIKHQEWWRTLIIAWR